MLADICILERSLWRRCGEWMESGIPNRPSGRIGTRRTVQQGMACDVEKRGRVWWHRPVILAAREAAARELQAQGQPELQ